ncbi:aldehyde dehydrogenase family protein [Streptomyces sulphureus]|uniref:aldehyde dehydrogenase family protein n=1 Tax=Streptomyces sulphureus TaxID=47758 RepID=UPI00037658FF|nr:aldehyde dehydrogenase family protein [Streptomyces sulphureus]
MPAASTGPRAQDRTPSGGTVSHAPGRLAGGFPELALQCIDGAWRPGSGSWDLLDFDPYTGERLASVTVATSREVDAAYRAAARAQREWAQTAHPERARIFTRAADLLQQERGRLTDLVVSESGSTAAEADEQFTAARELLTHAARLTAHPERRALPPEPEGAAHALHRRPVGVIGAITPSDLPLTAAVRTAGCALALGNAVVLKPHQSTPVAGGTLLAALLEAAGLPPGLLNIVLTDVAEIGDALLEHPVLRAVAFAGSAAAGRRIAAVAAAHLKRTVLQLRGNGAFFVLDDADVALAVEDAVRDRFLHRGTAAARVLVHRSIERAFTAKLVARVHDLRVGDPHDPHTDLGPLVDTSQAEAAPAFTEQAVAAGAVPLLRGRASGCLVHPTVLTALPPDSPVFRQEVPRPVLAALPFDDEEQTASLIASAPTGPVGAVHTAEPRRGEHLARLLGTAEFHLNGPRPHGIWPASEDAETAAAMVRGFSVQQCVSAREGASE